MQTNHAPTTNANVRVHGLSRMASPATISMTPATYIRCCGLSGDRCAIAGDTYFGHCVSRLKNLSAPAAIGMSPNVHRSVRQTDATTCSFAVSMIDLRRNGVARGEKVTAGAESGDGG